MKDDSPPTQVVKVNAKWSCYRPGVAQRVGRGIALLFHDHGTRRGWAVSSTPPPHFTPGKTRYSLHRRLGGAQGWSGRAENLVPSGIRSQTVQPIVSRYTDWATRPTPTHVESEEMKEEHETFTWTTMTQWNGHVTNCVFYLSACALAITLLFLQFLVQFQYLNNCILLVH